MNVMNSKTVIVCTLIFASCVNSYGIKQEKETIIPIDVEKIEILNINDFHNDYIDHIEYVSLETNDESLISQIDKVYLFKNNILIFDMKINKILLFGQDGKFKRQIGQKGGGPNEYSLLNEVFLDESSGLIYAHERMKNILFVYNLDGEVVNKIYPKFSFNSFCKTKEGFWLYTCFKDYNPKGYNLMLVDETMKTMIEGYFPQDPNFINVEFTNRFHIDNEGKAYFTYPTSNNIYRLNGNTPEAAYKIDFGTKTPPYEKIAKMKTHDEYNKLLENDYFKIGDYSIWNGLLLFSFKESALNKPQTTFRGIYDTKKTKLNLYRGFMTTLEIPAFNFQTSGTTLIFNIFPFELAEEHFKFIKQKVDKELDDDSNPILILCHQM